MKEEGDSNHLSYDTVTGSVYMRTIQFITQHTFTTQMTSLVDLAFMY